MKVSYGGRVIVLVCLQIETHRYHWLDFKALHEFVCSCSQEALSLRCWAGDVGTCGNHDMWCPIF